jgi:hypothetical protein
VLKKETLNAAAERSTKPIRIQFPRIPVLVNQANTKSHKEFAARQIVGASGTELKTEISSFTLSD